MKAIAHAILRLYCADCDHIIWRWQGRCGARHTSCAHRAILVSWRRNLEATGAPTEPWFCNWCHTRPTEARP